MFGRFYAPLGLEPGGSPGVGVVPANSPIIPGVIREGASPPPVSNASASPAASHLVAPAAGTGRLPLDGSRGFTDCGSEMLVQEDFLRKMLASKFLTMEMLVKFVSDQPVQDAHGASRQKN